MTSKNISTSSGIVSGTVFEEVEELFTVQEISIDDLIQMHQEYLRFLGKYQRAGTSTERMLRGKQKNLNKANAKKDELLRAAESVSLETLKGCFAQIRDEDEDEENRDNISELILLITGLKEFDVAISDDKITELSRDYFKWAKEPKEIRTDTTGSKCKEVKEDIFGNLNHFVPSDDTSEAYILDIARMKAVCSGCPVTEKCLYTEIELSVRNPRAYNINESHSVNGGWGPDARAKVYRKILDLRDT